MLALPTLKSSRERLPSQPGAATQCCFLTSTAQPQSPWLLTTVRGVSTPAGEAGAQGMRAVARQARHMWGAGAQQAPSHGGKLSHSRDFPLGAFTAPASSQSPSPASSPPPHQKTAMVSAGQPFLYRQFCPRTAGPPQKTRKVT